MNKAERVLISIKDGEVIALQGLDTVTAVSYTHLDVYKRQK